MYLCVYECMCVYTILYSCGSEANSKWGQAAKAQYATVRCFVAVWCVRQGKLFHTIFPKSRQDEVA